MFLSEVVEDTYQLSVNFEEMDTVTYLFEGLWELPNGVSVNSYIVRGEKTALIDGICGWKGGPESLIELIKSLEITLDDIDYVVINHMEPDHSGWLEKLSELKKEIHIYCSARSAELLDAFFEIRDNITIVKDGDCIDLGQGHILEFYEIPNVHWPDTIATFDKKTGVLFSCDAFGSFGRVDEKNYDDLLGPKDIEFYEKEAFRYYSNIVASFSGPVQKAIEKCSRLPIKVIAPSHGVVWRKDPKKIVNDYIKYARHQTNPQTKNVTLIWGTMYGMTEKAKNKVVEILKRENITFEEFRVPQDDIGSILSSSWNSSGIILGMPTYEYKMFPPMAAVLDDMGRKKVKNRTAFRFGSYGWSGGAEKELQEIMERHKMEWKFIPSVEFRGKMKQEDEKRIEEGVMNFLKEINK